MPIRQVFSRARPCFIAALAGLVAAVPAGGAQVGSGAGATVGPLLALSPTTGAPLSGFPQVARSGTVYALVDDGRGGWYVGGEFRSIGGVACPNLARIGSDRRVDRGWCPRPNGVVRALVRLGSRVYVGGAYFTRVAKRPRRNLAAFDTISGRLLPWNPGAGAFLFSYVYELAVDPRAKRLYVNGIFTRLGGAKRSNFGAVSTDTGRASAFAPNPDTNRHQDSVSAFAVTRTRIYTWGYYSEIGGHRVVSNGHALDPRSGRFLASAPKSDGGPYAMVVVDDTVYVGGVFNRLGRAARDDLGAFRGAGAAVTRWAPRTGAKLIVEQLARWDDRIVAALAASHWDAGPRRFAAYDLRNGRVVWQSPARLNGIVNVVAGDANTILIGGSAR